MTTVEKRGLSVCLVGCGGMGRLHGESILRHSNLSGLSVCDVDPSRAQKLAGELGAEWLPLTEALSSSTFDAFFVVTPAAAHVEQLVRIIPGGAYVFCEKPLGVDMATIDAAMPVLRPFADRIQVGFNRRFDPHMAALKQRILAGDIGEIEQLRIVSRDFSAPSVESLVGSAGLLFETAIHDFDLTRWLLDGEICELMCLGNALINPDYSSVGHIDTATTIMRGTCGQQVVIQNSWRTSYGYDQRVEAFGAGGRLAVSNPADPLVFCENADGLHRGPISSDWFARYPEAYFIQDTAFLNAVSSGDAVRPNLIDGYMASYIAQRASESQSAGSLVSCKLHDGEFAQTHQPPHA